MSDTLNLVNSIWPNGMKVDSDGYAVFYPLGTNKVNVPTSSTQWPKGDKLVSPFVYQDDKLVGFVDTKALTTDSQTLIYLPYEHIEAEFSEIDKGQLQIHAPNATTKKASWKDSEKEDIPEAQFKYKGCKTVEDVKTVDADYKSIDGTWSEPLWDLEQGGNGSWDGGMFYEAGNLTSFTSDLPNLTNGYGMFFRCYNLASFTSEIPSLTDGTYMFDFCPNLTSFTSDLSSLVNGEYMFYHCTALTAFSSDLSSLMNGYHMFSSCYLNTASVQNIADTINTPSSKGTIHISIANSRPNLQEDTAFNKMVSKNWTVYVNGSEYGSEYGSGSGYYGYAASASLASSLTTFDELGESEMFNPKPYWAKPVQTDEEQAKYVDEQGNYYNILGAQFIYGDDMSTYGMFTCESDAAANMCLTPYVKSQTEIENQ